MVYCVIYVSWLLVVDSGVATGVAREAECHPWQQKKCQKSGKIWKKEEKSGRKGKNLKVSFTLPPPDR